MSGVRADAVVAALERRSLLWPIAGTTAGLLAVLVAVPAIAVWALAAIAGLALVVLALAEPRWVVVAQLGLVGAYAVYVLQGRGGLPIAPSTLVLLALAGAALRRLVRADEPEVPWRELALLTAFGCALAASAAFSIDPATGRATLATYVQNAVLVGVVVYLLDTPTWLRRASWGFVAGTGLLAMLAVAHQLGNADGSAFGGFADVEFDRGLVRSTGPLSSNFFGQVLVATSALTLYLGLAAARRGVRLAGLGLAAVSVTAIWFTYSRASILALAFTAILVAVLRRIRLRTAVAVVAAAAVVVVGAGQSREVFEDHFRSLVDSALGERSTDASFAGRKSENLAALQMFSDNPLIGVGAGNYPAHYLTYSQEIGLDPRAEGRTPHSLYLQVLAETGTIGTVVMILLFGTAAVGAWRARRVFAGPDSLVFEGVFVAFAGFMFNAIFLHRAYEDYLWIMLALALAAARLGRRATRQPAVAPGDAPVSRGRSLIEPGPTLGGTDGSH